MDISIVAESLIDAMLVNKLYKNKKVVSIL